MAWKGVLVLETCGLRGFGTNVNDKPIRCSNALEGHHLLSKSKYRGAKAVKKYVAKHPEVFIADVCSIHNGATKLADTPAARRLLLEAKVELLTEEYVKSVWAEIPWKVAPPELSYAGIMSCPLP